MNVDTFNQFVLRGQAAQRAVDIETAIANLELYQAILTEPQLARVAAIANRPMVTVEKEGE